MCFFIGDTFMKLLKTLLITLIFTVLLTGCQKEPQYTPSDMSGYEGFTDTEHVFVEGDVKTFAQMMDQKKSFVAYFGFTKCPWCVSAVPVLNEVAKENKMNVFYINTRKNPEWKSNIDIDDYDLFVEKMDAYLDYDDDGIKHLYTPFVVFVKKGEVYLAHQGTVENHDATIREMNEEESQQLKEIYTDGFQNIK